MRLPVGHSHDNIRLMKSALKQTLIQLARLRHVDYRIFLAAFLVCGITSVSALRYNNEQMINLRNAVYAADKNGGDVSTALNNLRNYVYAHMNTNLSSGNNNIKPPIQLKYTYEKLEAQAQQAANNTGLYTAAENYCQAQIPTGFSGRYRISCVQDYINSHGGKVAAAIPTALYEFDFVSPTWSPDLAGWSLVGTVLFGLLFVISLLTHWFKLTQK